MKKRIWITVTNDQDEVIDRFPVYNVRDVGASFDDGVEDDVEFVGGTQSEILLLGRINRCLRRGY